VKIPDLAQFTPLTLVADFSTLLGTYHKGFTILIEPFDERYPNVPDPLLQLRCVPSSSDTSVLSPYFLS
jgi:DNA excision repair protein ERCC-2